MTRTQQLNVDCDREAKELAMIPPPDDRPTEVDGDAWTVNLQGTRLMNEVDPTI